MKYRINLDNLAGTVDSDWFTKNLVYGQEVSLRIQLAIAERLEAIALALEQSNSDEDFRDNVALYKEAK